MYSCATASHAPSIRYRWRVPAASSITSSSPRCPLPVLDGVLLVELPAGDGEFGAVAAL